jgi:hypothetical protein
VINLATDKGAVLAVVWGVSRRRAAVVPFAVAAYITAA